MIDQQTFRQWYDVFHGDDPLTEIRVLGRGKPLSGYFTDVEKALDNAQKNEKYGGLYAPINKINPACYSRAQRDKIMESTKSTTSDGDIERRRWIMIDLDPDRPSDTNASDDEKALADIKMHEVAKFLKREGFPTPVVADSGNGYHLYYRVDLPNTKEIAELVQTFLKALEALFSDEYVKVDTSVFNASRIAKIIGTMSNKGSNTKTRPQRMSSFVHVPSDILVTPCELIEKVAAILPVQEAPSRSNNWSTEHFDLDGFIERHGIKVIRRSRFAGGEKLILEQCPFDPNHKDAAILHLDNGALSYKCFHNSCQRYGWKDFWLHYDPQAYDRQAYDAFRYKRNYYSRHDPQPADPVKEDARGKIWLEMSDIEYVDVAAIPKIPTEIDKLDYEIGGGLCLGDVTIISGQSGAGKTSLLNKLILSAVDHGFKAAAWSGELQDFWFKVWLEQCAAGPQYVRKIVTKEETATEPEKFVWTTPKAVSDVIKGWLAGKFFLFNNNYGSAWTDLKAHIEKIVDEKNVNMILVDNLMALDFDGAASDNDVQTKFIKGLKEMCKKKNIHAVLVCHPRKEQSFQLLRKESIAGTSNLTNLCDNLFIIHRIGRDFERRAKEFLGDDLDAIIWDHSQPPQRYDVVIEISKNRLFGVMDAWIPMFYDVKSRRMTKYKGYIHHYGWENDPTVSSLVVPPPALDDDLDMPEDLFESGKY